MANKKITELPLINALSGSQIGGTVLPAVVGGTTNQISIENFSKFVNAYNAHTGSAGNIFSGPQTINNNVTINGRLTVNEVVTQYETASVLFSTGSTKLGDELSDKHEITGSTNITGSLIYNNVLVANIDINTISRLQQATQSLQVASASLQAHSASVDAQLLRLQQTTQSLQVATASLNAFTASQDSRNFTLSLYTASLEAQLQRVYQTTQSLHVATASLNAFTASQDARNFIISQFTSSTDAHIVGISDFTSSQLAVNLGNAIYTASVDNHIVGISDFTASQLAVNLGNAIYTASVDSHIVGISTYTSSVRDTLARVHQATASIQATTASINSFTSSTNAHIVGISTYTSSNESWKDGVRGEVSRIEAWTASLDNTYATDAQLYQLYQATRSIELTTGSLIGITNGLMAFTAALDSTYATDAQLYQLYQATRSIELHSGSMVGITNGLMAYTSSNETWKTGVRGEISAIEAWTASLDSTYATDAQLYQLYAETASMKAEIAGIEAYTASLKAQTIFSSSNQIFVNGTVISDNTSQKILGTSGNILYLYTGTSGLYINNSANNAQNVTITDAGVVTTRGGLTIGGPGNDQNLTFGGTNSSIYWGAGGPARMYYSTGDIRISSNGATDVLNVKNIGGIEVSGGITGSLMATNGVVSGSQQIVNYNKFAQTASANIFYGKQSITGSFEVGVGTSDNTAGDLFVDTTNKTVYVGRQSSTSGDNTIFAVRNRLNTLNALYVDAGGNGSVNITGSFEVSRGVKLGTATGNVEVVGNLVMTTAGNGIDFSATSNGSGTTSSELLNDYEEGTWTPVVQGSSTAGTYELTTANGTYTKIGRQVTLNCTIRFAGSITGGGSGYLQVTGAPFQKVTNTVAYGPTILNGVDFTGNYVSVNFITINATSILSFTEIVDNNTPIDLPISSVSANDEIGFSITYFT